MLGSRPGRFAVLMITVVLLGLALVGTGAQQASAAVPSGCSDLLLVAARGSGQTLEVDRQSTSESSTFFGEIRKHTPSGLSIAEYRLGDPGYAGHQYPAQGFSIPLGAAKTALYFNKDYERSVVSGVDELKAFLKDRHSACPAEEWIIGGYSQGGEVVTKALRDLPREVRDQVGYAAVFGDPLFDTGDDLLCRNGWWVRGNAKCVSIGARWAGSYDPPSDMRGRFGSWCDWIDPVCASGLGWWAHNEYPKAAIPAAALEAVSTAGPQHHWTVQNLELGSGSTGTDVMVVFDTTGSMGGYIDQAKEAARDLANKIMSKPNGRIGLVQFRDAGDSPERQLMTGLTADPITFRSAVDELYAAGGGDTPEAQLSGMQLALDEADWRPGATKMLVVITDAPGHDPDPITGATRADVIKRANEIDPVGSFGVDVCGCSDVKDFLNAVSENTGGTVIDGTSGLAPALDQAFAAASARPVVNLQSFTYAEPDERVQLSVEGSYDPDSTITGYRWDLDGNGTFETDTSGPTVEFDAGPEGERVVAAMVVSDDGGTGTAVSTLTVKSHWRAALTPDAPRNLHAAESTPGTVHLSWSAPAGADIDRYAVADASGPLASLPADVTTFDDVGVERGTERRYSVRAVRNSLSGPAAETSIAVSPLSPPTSPQPGGGAGPATPVHAASAAAKARVRSLRVRLKGNRIQLRISCPATAATACRVTLAARYRAKGAVEGRATTRIARGRSKTVTIKLKKLQAARLRRRGGTVLLTVQTTTTAKTSQTVKLKLLPATKKVSAPRTH